jgi:hypothetical protein
MSLTYRSEKGEALTFTELDNNFRYFTGSHAITGSLTASAGFYGDVTVPQAVTFKPITTPTVVTGGMFYSSSQQFYLESSSQWVPVLTAIPYTPNPISYNATVSAIYPSASSAQDFGTYLKSFISGTFGYAPNNTLLDACVCSDDIDGPTFININNIGQNPQSLNNFLGPFMGGGIGGYPHTGTTGLLAYASHVTYLTSGSLLIMSMPHIGITQQGTVGGVYRYGQSPYPAAPNSACGAVGAATNWVLSSSVAPTYPSFSAATGLPMYPLQTPSLVDYQQYTLTNILWGVSGSIIATASGSVGNYTMTAATWKLSTDTIRSGSQVFFSASVPQIATINTESVARVFFVDGIFINTDYDYNAYVNPVTFLEYNVASGSWYNYTTPFLAGVPLAPTSSI